MYPMTDIEARLLEHRQRVQRVEQTYWMLVESQPKTTIDHWQWRVMNKLGGWLVDLGCRLQTHVEQARHAVRTSPLAMEARSNTSQPCP